MVTGLMEPKLRMYSSQCTVVALSAGNRNKPKSIPAKPSPGIKFHRQRLASDEIKIRTCGSITALMSFILHRHNRQQQIRGGVKRFGNKSRDLGRNI
jgi:hypothetical protein